MSKNEVEWARYQSRLKFQRDQNMYLKDARESGLKEGQADNIRFCQSLLNIPMTPREDLLVLTLDELNAKVAELKAKLGAAIKPTT
jgi:hypothetical protein